MKKTLFSAAVLLAGLTACSTEEVVDVTASSNEVKFSTFVENPTKAQVATIKTVQGDGFTVHAYTTGIREWVERVEMSNFMKDNHAIYDQLAGWGVKEPAKYWPNEMNENGDLAKVTFFAFTPDDENVVDVKAATVVSDGEPNTNFQIFYSVPEKATEQKDLMADMAKDQTRDSNGGKVDFEFDHVLSRIGFRVGLADYYPDANVKVNSLEVYYGENMVKKTGKYTILDDRDEEETSRGPWLITSNDAFMDHTIANELVDESILLTNEVSEYAFPYANRLTDGVGNNKSLMLIPQEVEEGALHFMIKYSVTSGHDDNKSTINNEKMLEIPAAAWEAGKQYTYRLFITLQGVEIGDITVDDWAQGLGAYIF